jgi:hypothetical protein
MAKKKASDESTKLMDFMMDLAGDKQKQQALSDDPDAFLKHRNLPESLKESIKEAVRKKSADPIMKHVPEEVRRRRGNVQVNCII